MAKTTYRVGNTVKSYADKNYDPVKAHEYYMKHRKLKGGRRSAKSTSMKTGISSAMGSPSTKPKVRSSGNRPVTHKIGSTIDLTNRQTLSDRTSTAGLNNAGKTAVSNLKHELQAKKQEEEQKLKNDIETKIFELQYSAKVTKDQVGKSQLREQIKQLRQTYKDSKKAIKDKYDEAYASGVQKIKGNLANHDERSTAGLTDFGKAKAADIKQKLQEERKRKVSEFRQKHKQRQEEIRKAAQKIKEQRTNALRQIADRAKREIESIRKRINNMSPEQKKLYAKSLRESIGKIRDEVKQEKEKVKTDLGKQYDEQKQALSTLNSEYKTEFSKFTEEMKSSYDAKYVSELKKLKKDKNNVRGM